MKREVVTPSEVKAMAVRWIDGEIGRLRMLRAELC